jgi:HEPN domain-containing protein
MTQEEKIKYWVNLAEEDLAVGETLVKNKHNLYAGFLCQQAVEKILKGYFTKVKDETPPFIHNLLDIARRAGIYDMLNDSRKSLLKTLNPLNLEARYPEYKNRAAQYLTDENTKKIFEQTKEFLKWIKEKI